MTLARPVLAILCAMYTLPAFADVLVVGTTEHRGTFEGYADNVIRFRGADGKLLEPYRTRVRSLKLDTPRPVTVVRRGKQEGGTYRLAGYDGGKFLLAEGRKPVSVPAMYIDRVEPLRPAGGPDANAEADGPLDIAPLLSRRDLAAGQAAALRRYAAARGAMDAFVAESSRMVTAMDAATGRQRDRLMQELHMRKIREQPLRRELEQARAGLLAAVPPPWTQPPPDAPDTAPRPGNGPKLPELEEGQVLILDVSALRTRADLTPAQGRAVRAYEAAARTYEAAPSDPANAARLTQAQAALVKAFPDIRIVPE